MSVKIVLNDPRWRLEGMGLLDFKIQLVYNLTKEATHVAKCTRIIPTR